MSDENKELTVSKAEEVDEEFEQDKSNGKNKSQSLGSVMTGAKEKRSWYKGWYDFIYRKIENPEDSQRQIYQFFPAVLGRRQSIAVY